MTDSPKAVFLSYASQDADAARRIGEALRGAGIEVWLDTNELRGGDAWDSSIRKQIKSCALFMPIRKRCCCSAISRKQVKAGSGPPMLTGTLVILPNLSENFNAEK